MANYTETAEILTLPRTCVLLFSTFTMLMRSPTLDSNSRNLFHISLTICRTQHVQSRHQPQLRLQRWWTWWHLYSTKALEDADTRIVIQCANRNSTKITGLIKNYFCYMTTARLYPRQSHKASPAIWDQTVLPVTQQRWTWWDGRL